jgi:hypothetical protein
LYIKKLEQEVREFAELENNYKAVQSENYALREYVLSLQSRLLDAHGEYPQPPPNINLAHPHAPPPVAASSAVEANSAPSDPASSTSLEAVAQAVAGLARSGDAHHLSDPTSQYPTRVLKERTEEDTRTDEEISRQLQADGLASVPM